MNKADYLIVDFTPKEHKRIFKKISLYPKTTCWIWTGSKDEQGYGMLHYRGKTERIHRVMYSYYNGPIPRGVKARKNAQIDHKCNNTTCCNPEHLELVTQKTNVLRGNGITAQCARKTHCKYGHKLPEYKSNKPRRYCKECDRIRHKKRIQGPDREYWLEKARQSAKRYRDKHKNS